MMVGREVDRRYIWAVAISIGTLAFLFRIGRLTSPPIFDELYHLLAAESLLRIGEPAILDGRYTRTLWFTKAVALLVDLTGQPTLLVGRALSIFAGVLIPVVLFLWLRMAAGWIAGLAAAMLAILWVQGIADAQMLRFYSWQSLTFLLGAVAGYQSATASGLRNRLAWAGSATICLAVAFYLQITTAIGIVGIFAWLTIAAVLPTILTGRHAPAILAAIAVAGIGILAAAHAAGILEALWTEYRWVAGWAAGRQDDVGYYFWVLRARYPEILPILPLLAIVALYRHPRPASYCLVVFAVIFLGQSFGGMKTERYLSYGMPFLFGLVAIAVGAILPVVARVVVEATRGLDPTSGRRLALPILVIAVSFAIVTSTAGKSAIDALRGRTYPMRIQEDWSDIETVLGAWRDLEFRVTMNELQTIAALGDYDVLFSADRLTELPSDEEFTEDPRTGRPVFGEIDTLGRILDCKPEGLFLTMGSAWIEDDVASLLGPVLEAGGRRIETRYGGGVVALRWSGGRTGDPEACDRLPV